MKMTITAAVMRRAAAVTKRQKACAKENGDSNSNHLNSEESEDSESSDPGDREEGNKRDKKQDQRMLAKPWS